MTLINHTTNTPLATHLRIANSFKTRFIGLLGKRSFTPNSALLITPSTGVHTLFMRFPIDVIALDKQNRVVSTHKNVKPWRIAAVNPRTHSVIELPANTLAQTPINKGDRITYA